MKPTEDTAALKFIESVFNSEKNALNEEITRLSELTFKTDNEEVDNKSKISKLIVRRTFITEYERSKPMETSTAVNFLIDSKVDNFICPRCLVHNSSETLLTLDVIMGSGQAGEWRCHSCRLSYSPIAFNPIPTPFVPLPEV